MPECTVCRYGLEVAMEHGRIEDTCPHTHDVPISTVETQTDLREPESVQVPVGDPDIFSAVIAKIFDGTLSVQHHRMIMRMNREIEMIASAAQLPKRAREDYDEIVETPSLLSYNDCEELKETVCTCCQQLCVCTHTQEV